MAETLPSFQTFLAGASSSPTNLNTTVYRPSLELSLVEVTQTPFFSSSFHSFSSIPSFESPHDLYIPTWQSRELAPPLPPERSPLATFFSPVSQLSMPAVRKENPEDCQTARDERSPEVTTSDVNNHFAHPKNKFTRTCTMCGTTKTKQWRSGSDGKPSLCNACGLRFRKDSLGHKFKFKQVYIVPTAEAPKKRGNGETAALSPSKRKRCYSANGKKESSLSTRKSDIYTLLN